MNNKATNIGGVLFVNDYSTVIINGSYFKNNTAIEQVGVIRSSSLSSIYVIDTLFESNSANISASAVQIIEGEESYFQNCTFKKNSILNGTWDIEGKTIEVIKTKFKVAFVNCSFIDNQCKPLNLILKLPKPLATST